MTHGGDESSCEGALFAIGYGYVGRWRFVDAMAA